MIAGIVFGWCQIGIGKLRPILLHLTHIYIHSTKAYTKYQYTTWFKATAVTFLPFIKRAIVPCLLCFTMQVCDTTKKNKATNVINRKNKPSLKILSVSLLSFSLCYKFTKLKLTKSIQIGMFCKTVLNFILIALRVSEWMLCDFTVTVCMLLCQFQRCRFVIKVYETTKQR